YFINQKQVGEHECCQIFYNRHRSRQYAGIMSALSLNRNFFSVFIYTFLRTQNRGYRLESYSEIHIHSVGNSTLNPTGKVGLGRKIFVEQIVVIFTGHFCAAEPASILKTLARIDIEHCLREFSLEFPEN